MQVNIWYFVQVATSTSIMLLLSPFFMMFHRHIFVMWITSAFVMEKINSQSIKEKKIKHLKACMTFQKTKHKMIGRLSGKQIGMWCNDSLHHMKVAVMVVGDVMRHELMPVTISIAEADGSLKNKYKVYTCDVADKSMCLSSNNCGPVSFFLIIDRWDGSRL